jgi:hypothetical protein
MAQTTEIHVEHAKATEQIARLSDRLHELRRHL